MAKERSDGKDALDGRHLISVGALGAGVLLVLLLGAWLETDRAPERAQPLHEQGQPPPRTPSPALEVLHEAQAALPEQPVEAGPPPAALDARERRDQQRLSATDDGWLLQLAVMCDPANVRRTLADHGSDPSLLVLPARVAGRECHRICYGPFASRAQALGLRAIPAGLRALGEPQLRSAAEVLQ